MPVKPGQAPESHKPASDPLHWAYIQKQPVTTLTRFGPKTGAGQRAVPDETGWMEVKVALTAAPVQKEATRWLNIP